MNRRLLLFGIAGARSPPPRSAPARQARPRPPTATQTIPSGALRGANILLVTIDTLRADRVGAYGSPRV